MGKLAFDEDDRVDVTQKLKLCINTRRYGVRFSAKYGRLQVGRRDSEQHSMARKRVRVIQELRNLVPPRKMYTSHIVNVSRYLALEACVERLKTWQQRHTWWHYDEEPANPLPATTHGPRARPSNRGNDAACSVNLAETPAPSNFDIRSNEGSSPKTPSSYGFPEESLKGEDSIRSFDYPVGELLSEDEYFRAE